MPRSHAILRFGTSSHMCQGEGAHPRLSGGSSLPETSGSAPLQTLIAACARLHHSGPQPSRLEGFSTELVEQVGAGKSPRKPLGTHAACRCGQGNGRESRRLSHEPWLWYGGRPAGWRGRAGATAPAASGRRWRARQTISSSVDGVAPSRTMMATAGGGCGLARASRASTAFRSWAEKCIWLTTDERCSAASRARTRPTTAWKIPSGPHSSSPDLARRRRRSTHRTCVRPRGLMCVELCTSDGEAHGARGSRQRAIVRGHCERGASHVAPQQRRR
jgi:hypothetical protein